MQKFPAQNSTDKAARISPSLIKDVRSLIESARGQVATAVNAGLIMLYWHLGMRIRRDILGNQRASYGERIVPTLSAKLVPDYGRGFSPRNLSKMIRFAECFPDKQIVSTLSAQLGWSHFVEILQFDDSLQRDFYAEMCRIEKWNVRTLRAKIGGMLFERTGLAKKPKEVARMELAKLRKKD